MAKSIAKPAISKAAPKKVASKAKTTAKSKSIDLEKISKTLLAKLKSLQLDEQLQSEIVWCLGSYSHDKNPVGLIETSNRALNSLRTELARKTKGITAKFIDDTEKSLAG